MISSSFGRTIKRSNKELILACLPIVYIVAKVLVMKILPVKYFYDSLNIMSMMSSNLSYITRDKSFQFAADVFSFINSIFGFLNITDINEWHILLGLVFVVVFTILVFSAGEPTSIETIYLLAAFGLLEIYVFTISKDLCQFCIFCLIVVFYKCLPKNKNIAIVCAAIVLGIEGATFRTYYWLIAFMFIALVLLFRSITASKSLTSRKQLVRLVCTMFGIVLFIILVSFYFAKPYYLDLATVRDATNGYRLNSADARTVINNLVAPELITTNPIVLFINYAINAVRMLLPVELLTKGAMYIPFCVFQIATTYFIARALLVALESKNREVIFFLSVYLAYISISVMFEPDFGSWVRHDIATFPILLYLIVPKTIRCSTFSFRRSADNDAREAVDLSEENNASLRNAARGNKNVPSRRRAKRAVREVSSSGNRNRAASGNAATGA